ncbi:molybdopterin molybdotransferase MoeA [Pontibacter chinhatensis]|uniref:Molybdopterin molybdenumtransferase n=1 Tax=Pontibacter chinhatensis TaxID=1436961 RepID=A0A1I2RI28_9BACT|nr:molybdopterin molybdotransferase MoeA [Pontibacter chinhatensis]SFG40208.1 molybdopterin molybdochelatase [Pontibacter chinhatensis]
MIKVVEAEAIIQAQARNYGVEVVPLEQALGRVLAVELTADRDLPPFNRVAMDGIAIKYDAFESGTRSFRIQATQAAGDKPAEVFAADACVEIMTGAALPSMLDTVVRYEDLEIKDGVATVLTDAVKQGQNLHQQGKDKKVGEVVAPANKLIDAALIGVAASVGATALRVKTLPKVVVISTGDELVEVQEAPLPYQIRRSNSYTIQAALQQYGIQAAQLHIPDDKESIKHQLAGCLQAYDVLLLSGGISMGKYDFVPQVLEELQVSKLFHKVQQRPGKPFWFGKHANGVLVFALPGNPVSTFMCFHRNFVPWLKASIGLPVTQAFAALSTDFAFEPDLQYFLQVSISINTNGQLVATPLVGNGSGDFANLVEADAFLELPAEKRNFKQGEVYRIWPFKPVLY